ncbi:T-cell ecto-ADP-ribosyltransferase 1-like [Salmo salar]|uniref:NAD(P)(+)--arginine ADP-ribosyltransferase n=1 Tax=Salmo salar TaxID=8030 RepID=A0A1S3SLQ6_SALSA|nr:T-cell ecto-ADP-ribosyltransferase 1-like [Salmo salar]
MIDLLTFYILFWGCSHKKETTFPLDMAPNSIDDKYDGCRDEAFKRVDGYYLPHEKNTTTNFIRAWDIAEKHASIPKDGLQKLHSVSMYSYTNNKPQPPSESIYLDFNEAVREGRYGYGRSFQYHSLHFYLTDVIQILKQSQTCRTTYRRTNVYFDRNVLNKEIRFGFFASSSLNKSLHMFGNTSCFEINTCFDANLTYYFAYINESEVLIPSYEVFRITAVQTNTWCDVVYTLNSTGISKSNMNCRWVYNGAESNLRSSFYTFIRASDTDYIMLFTMLIIIVFH